MRERIRATAITAALALFLLAACGAQEALDEDAAGGGLGDSSLTVSEDIGLDSFAVDEADIDASKNSELPSIEQPLPEEEIPDINLIIKDAAEMANDDGAAEASDASDADGDSDDSGSANAADSSAAGGSSRAGSASGTTSDWFAGTGKAITPSGAFTLVTTVTDDAFSEDIEERMVECTMDITTVPSDLDNYHTIVATLMLDCDDALIWEMIPFDRYSGEAMVIHRLGNGDEDCTGSVEADGRAYDVSYNVEIGRGSDGRASSVYKVTVPESYDGLLFYVGYANTAIAEQDDEYLREEMKLSDMPSWGSASEFFFKP